MRTIKAEMAAESHERCSLSEDALSRCQLESRCAARVDADYFYILLVGISVSSFSQNLRLTRNARCIWPRAMTRHAERAPCAGRPRDS